MRILIIFIALQNPCIAAKLLGPQTVPSCVYLGTKARVSLRERLADFAMHATSTAAVNRIAGSTTTTSNVGTSADAHPNARTGVRPRDPKTNFSFTGSSLLSASCFFGFFLLNPVKLNFSPSGLFGQLPYQRGYLRATITWTSGQNYRRLCFVGLSRGFSYGSLPSFHNIKIRL